MWKWWITDKCGEGHYSFNSYNNMAFQTSSPLMTQLSESRFCLHTVYPLSWTRDSLHHIIDLRFSNTLLKLLFHHLSFGGLKALWNCLFPISFLVLLSLFSLLSFINIVVPYPSTTKKRLLRNKPGLWLELDIWWIWHIWIHYILN